MTGKLPAKLAEKTPINHTTLPLHQLISDKNLFPAKLPAST